MRFDNDMHLPMFYYFASGSSSFFLLVPAVICIFNFLFRDEPGDNPIVCSNNGKDCKLTIMGDNLFAALKKNIE